MHGNVRTSQAGPEWQVGWLAVPKPDLEPGPPEDPTLAMAEVAEVGGEATGVAMAAICPEVVGGMEEGAIGEQRRLAVNCTWLLHLGYIGF